MEKECDIDALNPRDIIYTKMRINTAKGQLSKEEFDKMMETGLRQAKENDSFDADEVFKELESDG